MSQQPAEFDSFAPGYNAGMDDLFKQLTGQSAAIFLEHKAAWLNRHLTIAPGSKPRLLEFGCGTGGFLRALQTVGVDAQMEGCDVSEGMIDEARQNWPVGAEVPPLHHTPAGTLPFADASFDIITAVCVFHHIPPGEWEASARELERILKPGGSLLIFEHNPWNPATRMIVKRCPIDQNAVLLPAPRTRRLLRDALGVEPSVHHILFFPPRWRSWWSAERWFEWLPIGGQYVVVGTKRSALALSGSGISPATVAG